MNDFDKILRQKLEGYTEMPPESVFENVCKNIPKRTFADILSAHKYLLISSAVAVAVVTAVIIAVLPDGEKSENISVVTPIENITPDAAETNGLLVESNIINGETPAPLQPNSKVPELITQSENKIDVLNLNDTIICGNELLIEGIDVTRIKASKGLNLEKVASGVKLTSETYGTHTLELSAGGSVKITFVEAEKLSAKVSKSDLCYGENLLVDVATSALVAWNDDEYSVRKICAGSYEVSGLHKGNNNVVLTVGGRCTSKLAFNVNVAERPEYSISTKDNYCSGGNGRIEVKSSSPLNYCRINGSEISRNGVFSGLNSGTYRVELNYGSCIAYDTVIVKDNTILKAKFESSRDAFNDKAYIFHNYTRLDDSGNTQNVDFEWLVNGVVISTDYNFDYEFKSNGKYVVELVARTGDCESRYSEAVTVASSDFRIPNVFTPNGDGIGDEFTIIYDGTLIEYDLSIYTKSGQLVFHSNEIDKCWDGKVSGNNEASEGVYFYVITATSDQNEKLSQKGTIQLIRR